MVRSKPAGFRKLLTSVDAWLAAMAVGLIVMLAVHVYLWRSMVALVKPGDRGSAQMGNAKTEATGSRANGDSKAIDALRAAGEGDTFARVVSAANPGGSGAAVPAWAQSSPDLVARFDSFAADPSRSEFAAKVVPFFKPGDSPADHSLAFLLNLQLSNVAVPPDIDELKAKAYAVMTEHAAESLSATHRTVTLLDESPEAMAFREVLRKVVAQIGSQPEISTPEQRRQLDDIERFLSGN